MPTQWERKVNCKATRDHLNHVTVIHRSVTFTNTQQTNKDIHSIHIEDVSLDTVLVKINFQNPNVIDLLEVEKSKLPPFRVSEKGQVEFIFSTTTSSEDKQTLLDLISSFENLDEIDEKLEWLKSSKEMEDSVNKTDKNKQFEKAIEAQVFYRYESLGKIIKEKLLNYGDPKKCDTFQSVLNACKKLTPDNPYQQEINDQLYHLNINQRLLFATEEEFFKIQFIFAYKSDNSHLIRLAFQALSKEKQLRKKIEKKELKEILEEAITIRRQNNSVTTWVNTTRTSPGKTQSQPSPEKGIEVIPLRNSSYV